MPFRRGGRPGLIGTMARTAVVAGTASAVVNRGNERRDARQQAANEDQQSQHRWPTCRRNSTRRMPRSRPPPSRPPSTRRSTSGWRSSRHAVPAQSGAADDTMAKLQKLADMKSQGLLSDQEFAAMKGKLLGI